MFTMTLTRPELEDALLALEASIPTIKTLSRPESRLATFNADAYMIQSAASGEDIEYVRHQLQRMVATSGLIPGKSRTTPMNDHRRSDLLGRESA